MIISLVGKVCPGKEPPPIAVCPSFINAGISSFFSFWQIFWLRVAIFSKGQEIIFQIGILVTASSFK